MIRNNVFITGPNGGPPINLAGQVTMDANPGTDPLILPLSPFQPGGAAISVPEERRYNGGWLTWTCDGGLPMRKRVVTNGIEGGTLLGDDNPYQTEPSVIPFPGRAVPRAPLPPWPTDQGDFARTLITQPPAGADKRYWRCNFGCVTIPGLPWVPGMEGLNFDRVLTGFLGRYTTDWQQRIVDTYAQRPYTHFLRWVQDEQAYPGYSIGKYVDECKRIKDAGIAYIAHSFLSKDYAPFNPSPDYLRSTFGPLIDALQAANMLDISCVGFELTLVSNGNLFDIVDYFAVERGLNEGNGIPCYVHHISGYTWPGPVGGIPDRFQWWAQQQGKLTGLLYQCDPAWTLRMMQDRIRDTTDNTGEGFPNTNTFGHPFDMVPLEPKLTLAFGDGASQNEDDLDLCGLVLLCTPGQLQTQGFGCGGRREDGPYL